MQKKFSSLLILSVFVLSIFSISIAAAAGSDCNLWCRIAALFTGKIPTTGQLIVIQDSGNCRDLDIGNNPLVGSYNAYYYPWYHGGWWWDSGNYRDGCLSSTTLREYFASGNLCNGYQDYDCTNLNPNYRCISVPFESDSYGSYCGDPNQQFTCIEGDGGFNPTVGDRVQWGIYNWTDKCITSIEWPDFPLTSVLMEAVCNQTTGLPQYITINCIALEKDCMYTPDYTGGGPRYIGYCGGYHAPVCGDGIKSTSETCDGSDFGEQTCASIKGAGWTGTLICNSCTSINTSNCRYCGNEIIEPGEACEIGDTDSCTTPQGYAGNKACLPNCTGYGTCVTSESCGDGIINDAEVCDGTKFEGKTCETEKGTGWTGTLICNSCTSISTSQCNPPAILCSETDIGNDPLHAGTTILTQLNQTIDSKPDACIISSRNLTEYYCSGAVISSANINCQTYDAKWGCVNGQCQIPEFTSIGAGIALIGASVGYALIRRKRK